MATKQRYQNPVINDNLILNLFAYNSNNKVDFYNVEKVEIYFLDPQEVSDENKDGRTLLDTITGASIVHDDVGMYHVSVTLDSDKYTIGNYIDVWYAYLTKDDVEESTIENTFRVYPDLFFTSPNPIIYDFDFVMRPNKIRAGSKRYLEISITPNVPSASDLARYYENLAIVSPLQISIEQVCGDCLPEEQDLRVVVDQDAVTLRDKMAGYYLLDTTDMKVGIYNVFFTMVFGDCTYISENQQLQIFE